MSILGSSVQLKCLELLETMFHVRPCSMCPSAIDTFCNNLCFSYEMMRTILVTKECGKQKARFVEILTILQNAAANVCHSVDYVDKRNRQMDGDFGVAVTG